MNEEFPPSRTPKPSMVWMLSFADLLSLLLAFFVMLYAMSQTGMGKWGEAAQSLQKRLNPGRVTASLDFSSDRSVPKEASLDALGLGYLMPVLRSKLLAVPALHDASVRRVDDRVVILLPGDALFGPSESALTASAKEALSSLADILGALDNAVEVVGHTEPGVPSDRRFETGWELSLARAAQVAKALRDAGYERPLVMSGMSASRYPELDDTLEETQRHALSRRVDLVLSERKAP